MLCKGLSRYTKEIRGLYACVRHLGVQQKTPLELASCIGQGLVLRACINLRP